MAKYDGYNGEDLHSFAAKVRARIDAMKQQRVQNAIEKCRKAQEEIDAITEEFRGAHTSNINAHFAQDELVRNKMFEVQDQLDQMRNETDELIEQMQASMQILEGSTESDVEYLERLYSQS